MLVHDDPPRIKWKLAVIKGVNKGADGLIQAADIQTTTSKVNQLIVHLHSLEDSIWENYITDQKTEPFTSSAIDTNVPTLPGQYMMQERMEENR